MSSNEEDYNENENPLSKKRRVQRACDICRRKKIRCDGGQMPGNRCSNCIAYSFDCTYVEAAKKRGPPKGYVERLENRVEKLEKVLTRLYPGYDILKELDAVADADAWLVQKVPFGPLPDSEDKPAHSGRRRPTDIATEVIRKVGTPHQDYPEDDDFAHVLLARDFNQLHLDIDSTERKRFFGKSSSAMLVHEAMELKNVYTGVSFQSRAILGNRRHEFWTTMPWERPTHEISKVTFEFPPDDLMSSLVDIYFEKTNFSFPLLHAPTFKRSIAEGLHLRDDSFGANVLLVCAVASRFSDDQRVLMDGVESWYSAGWKWFHQVQQLRKSLLAPPSLYDLQFYCLSVMFLQGSSAPQSCWTMIGIGIRLAQDVGAHRRKFEREHLTVEDELWKRAFWILVTMDRLSSAALGRPCAIQDEDFDVDLPVECDDEYWEHSDPSQRFKQPPNKPSYVTGFILLLKLNQVLAILLRTIYSINKSKITLGFIGHQWEQHIVAELDSALNKWIDSVPDHLRWDPARENLKFFEQSAWLYSMYYFIQILIHRSFIPSPSKPFPLSFPSLAICTNAARSCSHIVELRHRRGLPALPQIQMTTFTAGVVLLLNIWSGRRSGLNTDPSKEMLEVHKCMQALRRCEVRWPSAGRLWDILYELASVGELPLPKPSPPANNKRDRDADSPASSSTLGTNSPSLSVTEAPRTIAGSRRVNAAGKQPATAHGESQPPTEPPMSFALPLYSNELGRLPINPHEQSSASSQSFGQSAQNQGLPPTYWGPGLPDASLPFNMDMYTQFGYNSPSFVTSASAPNTLFEGGKTSLGDADTAAQSDQAMIAGQGQYATGLDPNMQALIDNDTVAMWSNAPSGFELDDWGTYLSSVSELTQGVYHAPSGG
ncbi:putative fungal specific transcription factor [Lyophyllum shimeji]|uniref:Fungal specific transcription factor n=1 Tax=Lyophyllum shimeji TaxID=47721 RepID=A0A9P3Q283_LYOSH|nr:putative fungal specific transcription factor [Lyophyllum shimeji]